MNSWPTRKDRIAAHDVWCSCYNWKFQTMSILAHFNEKKRSFQVMLTSSLLLGILQPPSLDDKRNSCRHTNFPANQERVCKYANVAWWLAL